jgi:RNA 3'-terminal phosphate cyclase (ATP)
MPPILSPPIHLEGTTLEGGGQLVRLALSLVSLTGKPVHITDIRGNRHGGGGLKTQHLTSLQWLGQACNARISGAGLKSKEITFRPDLTSSSNTRSHIHDDIRGGHVNISQSTPGSVLLVLQAVLPYLLFSGSKKPVRLRITGGTNVLTSPSHDYIDQVLLPMLSLIGIPRITAECHSRGWSTGGTRIGSATYTITPLTCPLPAFQLTHRGAVKSVQVTILAPRNSERDFRDELDVMFDKRASRIFGSTEPDIEITFEDSHHDKRFYLLFVATTTTGNKLGRDWLYDKAVRLDSTARIVPDMVRKVSGALITELEHGGCVDEFLWDQLVVFQALAEGRSSVYGGMSRSGMVQPSLHAQTARWVAEQILGVEFDGEGACQGVRFVPGWKKTVEEDLPVGVKELDVSASV